MKYHLTPVKMAIINKSITIVNKDVEKGEPLCTVCGNADWCSHSGKQYGVTTKFFKKMELPYDPAILLLGIYLKKPKTLI